MKTESNLFDKSEPMNGRKSTPKNPERKRKKIQEAVKNHDQLYPERNQHTEKKKRRDDASINNIEDLFNSEQYENYKTKTCLLLGGGE